MIISLQLSVMTLIINRLNSLIKRCILAEKKNKQDSMTFCLQEIGTLKHTERKVGKKIFQVNVAKKKKKTEESIGIYTYIRHNRSYAKNGLKR